MKTCIGADHIRYHTKFQNSKPLAWFDSEVWMKTHKTRNKRSLRIKKCKTRSKRYKFKGKGGQMEKKAMVIVEPRKHDKLPAVITNFDTNMPKDWDLYFFYGKGLGDNAKEVVKGVTGRKVILNELDKDNFTADEYSILLRTADFWKKVDAETILVFQTDGAYCSKSKLHIDKFTKYDYIGCSYFRDSIGKPNSTWTGDQFYGVGGISLRKKSFMMKCIEAETKNPRFRPNFPEDVFYSEYVADDAFSKNRPESASVLHEFCSQQTSSESLFAHKISEMNPAERGNFTSYCPEATFMIGGNVPTRPDFGIIFTRHVTKPEHNRLYKECYACIRKYYPNEPIVIIDDNSTHGVLVEDPDMKNVTIVKSEYPGRGEFLPYYYLLKDKYVSKALILQDSMFLNTMIKKDSITSYKFLYEFDPNKFGRDIQNIEKILDSTKKPLELKEFLKTDTWRGCWGTCSVITLAFLEKLDAELGISNLVSVIKTRADRMCLERAFGLMCMYMELKENPSIFGKIEDRKVHSVDGKYNFDEYLTYKYDDPIRKVWNGR